jgi:hypothetical protein
VQEGPSPIPPTIQQDQVEVATEGEVASRREAPRRVQVDHPPSAIIGDINEHMTWPPLSRKTLDTLYLILIS